MKQLYNIEAPHYIKYMGSKTKILPFIIDGIQEVYQGGAVCDLFAGSCSLAGAIGDQVPIISNDIQHYSAILAKAYLTDWNDKSLKIDDIVECAQMFHKRNYSQLITAYEYSEHMTIDEFNRIEKKSQNLINQDFDNEWHLFTKYYSGTWWSVEQCTWIDSLRMAIEQYKQVPFYNTLLSCLMYASAYNSQGTGHYAQYRDANTISAMEDIKIYRSKSILYYFTRKAQEVVEKLNTKPNLFQHSIISKDYLECLSELRDTTVYADPPYCFVHYSRFYHALETMVLYDYPQIQTKGGKIVKGRYRVDRHQSPFCIKTKVKQAFNDMFTYLSKNNCSLVLSYSNTGMITLDELFKLANQHFSINSISIKSMDYTHMTMGRKEDRSRQVNEILLMIKSQ